MYLTTGRWGVLPNLSMARPPLVKCIHLREMSKNERLQWGGAWCRGLLSDYREACREVVVGVRTRPVRSSFYLALLAGCGACVHGNPDRTSFEARLLECSNRLALMSPWTRSAASDAHVQRLAALRNAGLLRHASLGVASLVYSSEHGEEAGLYEACCPGLAPPWWWARQLPGRLLDVGFAGRWWQLDARMEDFDVNAEEFKHLPEHMRATLPPGVQEVERNERLHRDSWLPIKMENVE